VSSTPWPDDPREMRKIIRSLLDELKAEGRPLSGEDSQSALLTYAILTVACELRAIRDAIDVASLRPRKVIVYKDPEA
jgi:hypothetical protein